MTWRTRLRSWLKGSATEDGLGQSFLTDLRWLNRFRAARRRPIAWRAPTRAESRWWLETPPFDRFADDCVAVAEVDGRRWAVLERLFSGWPDPPTFVWFAIDPDETIWAAADFDGWPKIWGPLPVDVTTTPPP